MDFNELKGKILAAVQMVTDKGAGIRTTEVDELYRLAVMGSKPPNIAWNDGLPEAERWYGCRPERGLMKSALLALWDDNRLTFVTEAWRDGRHGDYCWIVPAGWKDIPRSGFVHIPKKETAPFDLW